MTALQPDRCCQQPTRSDRGLPPATPEAGFHFPPARAGTASPPVMLIHGLTGTPAEVRFLGKRLNEGGFEVHGLQLPGHCGGEADLLATGWRDWYRAVEATHATLCARHGRVLVAGLCLGGLLALHLACRHPATVKGVALYSVPLWYDGWSLPRLSRLLPVLLAAGMGSRWRFVATDPFGVKDARIRAHIAAGKRGPDSSVAGLPAIAGASLRELAGLTALVKSELAAIATPALIVHSREDDLSSLRSPRHLAARLRGPTRTLLLDDCYHLVTLDRQRETVAAETATFFRDIAAIEAAASLADRMSLPVPP